MRVPQAEHLAETRTVLLGIFLNLNDAAYGFCGFLHLQQKISPSLQGCLFLLFLLSKNFARSPLWTKYFLEWGMRFSPSFLIQRNTVSGVMAYSSAIS